MQCNKIGWNLHQEGGGEQQHLMWWERRCTEPEADKIWEER